MEIAVEESGGADPSGAGSPPVARLRVCHAGQPPGRELAARMFEPFYSSRPGESAIGLYAAKELASSMGWEISVVSPSGGLTGFSVTAPLW